MKSYEPFISKESDYYVHLPSSSAQRTFFYPICTGHFFYEPGYALYRDAYDSFLLMYIQSGQLALTCAGVTQTATAGQFVLLDCYRPHAYTTDMGCESLWCHFDGPAARAHYELIVSHLGNVFLLSDPNPILHPLTLLYRTFQNGKAIREALFSRQLTDMLTGILLSSPAATHAPSYTNILEETLSYIHENFTKELTVQALADRAQLSPYHFIRVFKKETGFTPHEYLRNIRLNNAKYLLNNTSLSVKDICFCSGFSNESVFCTSFKKHCGVTPSQYRNSVSHKPDGF